MDMSKYQANPYSKMMYKWEDITKEFFEAVKDVALDELIHDKLFNLFETMSAIEMMDPKMDAGMKCNRKNNKLLEEAINTGKLKFDNFSNSEIIGIMDATLALLVSWLEGNSLIQTVFTNLYLHNPYCIKNDILKTFCLAIYKIIDIITNFIYTAMVYEEEDFQAMTYDYELNPDISKQNMICMLCEVEEDLLIRSRVKKFEKKYTQEEKELSALLSRIKFIRAFYKCLYCLSQLSASEKSVEFSDCEQLLDICKAMLLVLQNTINLGVQSKDPKNEMKMIGIEPLINQRFLPPSFFQYTKIKSRSEALNYLNKLIARLIAICKVNNFVDFHYTIDFFIELSRNESCVLSRSVLQLLYIKDPNIVFGNIRFIDVLKDAVSAFISPPVLRKTHIIIYSDIELYISNFFSLCTQPFINFIQICGYNRAKQRSKLIQLLQIFAKLQNEAQKIDEYLRKLSVKYQWSKPHLTHFSTWILYHTLKIMVMYLQTGFELQLYSVHEYYYIFWYLYEYSYGWLVSVLTRADSFLLGQHISEIKGKPNKKTKNKNKTNTLYKYHQEIVYNRALQNMCGGYYKTLLGFQRDGKIKLPHLQFNTEQIRYEHRFAPFAGLVSPPSVPYSKFVEMISPINEQPVNAIHLYRAGCKHFHQASCLLKSIKSGDSNISNLLKVAKANITVLKHIAVSHKEDLTGSLDFEFLFHKYLPVIKLN